MNRFPETSSVLRMSVPEGNQIFFRDTPSRGEDEQRYLAEGSNYTQLLLSPFADCR